MSAGRAKSCQSCRVAKTRCSLETPCLRCFRKSLECHYAPVGSRRRAEGLRDIRPAAHTHGRNCNPLPRQNDASPGLFKRVGPDFECSPESSTCVFQSEELAPTMERADGRSELPIADDTAAYPLSDSFNGSKIFLSGPFPGDHNTWRSQAHDSGLISWDSNRSFTLDPTQVSFRNVSNAPQLMERGRSLQQGSLTAKMILRRMGGYTRGIASGRLPPFVHQSCLDSDSACALDPQASSLPSILDQCARNIGEFHESAGPGAWEPISDHILQMRREHENFDDLTLLQAMQAAILYGILCSQHSVGLLPEYSRLSVTCIEILGKRLFSMARWTLEADVTSRKQWILVESIRRIACVLYLIDLLLFVDTETPSRGNCDTFWDMPLPCHQALWQATSDEQWKALYARTKSNSLTLGRLLLLRQSRRLDEVVAKTGGSAIAEELVEWCENADDLSMLLWMALTVEGEGQSSGSDVVC